MLIIIPVVADVTVLTVLTVGVVAVVGDSVVKVVGVLVLSTTYTPTHMQMYSKLSSSEMSSEILIIFRHI